MHIKLKLFMKKNNIINKKITDFFAEHHVLTLSTANDNKPYSCNCFYAYLLDENLFVCTSDEKTKHVQDIRKNNYVSGSVVLETKTIGKIQGVQFNGFMSEPDKELLKKSKKAYLKLFPYAVLMKTKLWVIELTFIKMTDNRLGFGKKLIWEEKAVGN